MGRHRIDSPCQSASRSSDAIIVAEVTVDAEIRTLVDIFSSPVQLLVPPLYQRPYVWERSAYCRRASVPADVAQCPEVIPDAVDATRSL
jgi:hypothetical protein